MDFEQILSEAGITLTEEQKKTVAKGVEENYKLIADWKGQEEKVNTLEKTLEDTQKKLKAFDGVDAEALNKQIEELKGDLEKKDAEYKERMADRDFNELIQKSIGDVNGRNAKAITALLDLEALKASKNQKEDVAAALKALSEAEDSKMLFGEPEPNPVGTGNIIGQVRKTSVGEDDALMRAAMGLPPVTEQK